MKKALILLLCVTVSYSLFSQNKKAEQSLSIAIGPSFPLGDFGKTDLQDNGSGFAGIGQALNINYFLSFSKNFGLIITASGQRNPLNTKKMEEAFNDAVFYQPFVYGWNTVTAPVLMQSNIIKYEHWNFKKNSWLSGSVMAGIQMSTEPDKNNINFYSRVQFGALYLSMPKIEGESKTDTAIASFTQTGSHGIGFACSFSGGMNYSLSKKTFLFVNAGWIGTASIKLEDIESTMMTIKNPGNPGITQIQSSSIHADGKQSLQSVNITFGIGLRL